MGVSLQLRDLLSTDLFYQRATISKRTTGIFSIRGGNFSFQQHALSSTLHLRVRCRCGGQQGLRVGMSRILVKLLGVSQFNNPSQVHYANAMSNMPNHGQVMSNEYIRQSQLLLQLCLEKMSSLML